jgi:hypothetical protein
MNRKIRVYSWVLGIIILLGISAFGQSARLNFDLDHLAKKAVETVNVTLDRSMLESASKFLSPKEASQDDVKKLIEGLEGIWVRSFEFDKEGAYSQDDVNAIRKQLEAPGWTCMVKVESKKKGGETADVCVFQEGERILGLAVLVAEPKELTLVNIIGAISLDQLTALQGKFGIPKGIVKKPGPERQSKVN